MESSCVRHTDLPHTSRLFSDFLYAFERVRGYYSYDPRDPQSYPAAARGIRFPLERRAALVSALREQNPGNPALDALARPDTLAVVTGQQVGLFCGPAYTVYKALTAIRLARQLTDSGIPSVPVFWLATEDHDFAEVNHCYVFDAARRPVRVEAAAPDAASRPVGRIPVQDGTLGALRNALAEFPFAAEALALAGEAYAPGRTFGSAFAGLMKRLFSPYGLLVVDPLDSPVRQIAAPLLRDAVAAVPELVPRLLERGAELERAGYHAQVHVDPHTSLLFLLEGDIRVPLRRTGETYGANGRSYSAATLAERAEQLSPNALLRPVVQDFILPTVAYVGGPAELAYLAQSQVLYRALLGRAPVAVHRASFTLLDSRASRLVDRYGLHLPDFFAGDEALRERIAGRLVPAALEGRIEETRLRTAELLDQLGADVSGFDPTLGAAFSKSRAKVMYQLSKIERKIARETLRRNSRAVQDADYLMGLVYPDRHLQERLYSILPFLAVHGPDLIARIEQEIVLTCPDHRVLSL